ncbi:hypothetical protein MmiHf6_12500 [Methanimicrococcus hongohii]|uniref:Uncharacterized protein n=1 Tax=Methanimicrococcus hongohii TaxID=3028295 RepID=A0AA96V9I3_9EURY|nr:hypothetical protein MmiHf6_12500 [Methanimicrococcus sp. Hf6]
MIDFDFGFFKNAGRFLCHLFKILALARGGGAAKKSLRDFFSKHLPPTANKHLPPTTNKHLPPTANKHHTPTANKHLPPTANKHHTPTANRRSPQKSRSDFLQTPPSPRLMKFCERTTEGRSRAKFEQIFLTKRIYHQNPIFIHEKKSVSVAHFHIHHFNCFLKRLLIDADK